MSHLKHITFNNFRVFENKTKFEICPITFLTGPNSSGKSSVLKSLLLLKSNNSSSLQVLDFSGPKHNLGTFDNTLNNKTLENNVMSFGFQVDISEGKLLSSFIKEPVITKRDVYNVLKEHNYSDCTDIYIVLSYKRNGRSGKLFAIEIFLKGNKISFLKLEIGDSESKEHRLKFDYNQIDKNSILNKIFIDDVIRSEYKVQQPNEVWFNREPIQPSVNNKPDGENFDEPIKVFRILYELFLNSFVKQKSQKDLNPYLVGNPLRRILKDLASIIENTEYLEAVRANTKRLYTNDSQGTSFNELILDYRSRDISKESIDFTNKWLNRFGIAKELVFDNIEGVATTIYLKKGDKEEDKIALADLGYGITQFLPIILKIALEEPIKPKNGSSRVVKKLILLEEPETNLHPKLQSLIADFLVDAINTFEIRFIIETHSEYIIRKAQILTADKIIDKNDSIIYYFNNPEDEYEEQIIKINISEKGMLSNEFGGGFYDEATNLKFELLKRKMKK